jgi:transcriptional regulator with XRE-family HTH domain
VTEGGIGLSKRVVNGYDRGRVRSAGDAGRNAAVGYRMTDGSLPRRFGELVRRRRSEAGFSQEEFALRCGLHRTYLGSIEWGREERYHPDRRPTGEGSRTTLADLFLELKEGSDVRVEQYPLSRRFEHSPHELFGRELMAVLRGSLCLWCGPGTGANVIFEAITTGKGSRGDLDNGSYGV